MIKTISNIDLSSALRRSPTQQRSKDKVRNILEAADRLLPEYGYEALVQSPWPIVEASGVTAGVFYNYFENGEAVLEALSLLYAEQTKAVVDELATETFDSWEDAVDAVNDRFAEFYSQATVRELWLNNRLSQTARLAGREANDHIHKTVVDLIERASGDRIKFTASGATILANLGDKLLRFVFEQPESDRKALMHELKKAMKSYAATFVATDI